MIRTLTFIITALIMWTMILGCNYEDSHKTSGDTIVQARKIRICTELVHLSDTIKGIRAIGHPDEFWPQTTKRLTVQFMDGSPAIQEKVTQIAKEWENYCGITFQFGKFKQADITISFEYPGSWSVIGKDSKYNSPSMNFGWFDASTTDEEYKRVVLHEFGHALGLYHEHSNGKNNPIKWDTKKVYAYYKEPPNNWEEDEVDFNVLARYNSPYFKGTSFDKKSIMLYAVPKDLTTDKLEIDWNTELSDTDKSFINGMYPRK